MNSKPSFHPSDPDRPSLAGVAAGGRAMILGLIGDRGLTQRLTDLGFWPGTTVEVVCGAPFGGAAVYRLRGYRVALRSDEAACVEVTMVPSSVAPTVPLALA